MILKPYANHAKCLLVRKRVFVTMLLTLVTDLKLTGGHFSTYKYKSFSHASATLLPQVHLISYLTTILHQGTLLRPQFLKIDYLATNQETEVGIRTNQFRVPTNCPPPYQECPDSLHKVKRRKRVWFTRLEVISYSLNPLRPFVLEVWVQVSIKKAQPSLLVVGSNLNIYRLN